MKLRNELDGVIADFKKYKDGIAKYADHLKQVGGYENFSVRLAWDCLRAIKGSKWICDLYDKYDCNDKHITTLALRALNTVYDVK